MFTYIQQNVVCLLGVCGSSLIWCIIKTKLIIIIFLIFTFSTCAYSSFDFLTN